MSVPVLESSPWSEIPTSAWVIDFRQLRRRYTTPPKRTNRAAFAERNRDARASAAKPQGARLRPAVLLPPFRSACGRGVRRCFMQSPASRDARGSSVWRCRPCSWTVRAWTAPSRSEQDGAGAWSFVAGHARFTPPPGLQHRDLYLEEFVPCNSRPRGIFDPARGVPPPPLGMYRGLGVGVACPPERLHFRGGDDGRLTRSTPSPETDESPAQAVLRRYLHGTSF